MVTQILAVVVLSFFLRMEERLWRWIDGGVPPVAPKQMPAEKPVPHLVKDTGLKLPKDWELVHETPSSGDGKVLAEAWMASKAGMVILSAGVLADARHKTIKEKFDDVQRDVQKVMAQAIRDGGFVVKEDGPALLISAKDGSDKVTGVARVHLAEAGGKKFLLLAFGQAVGHDAKARLAADKATVLLMEDVAKVNAMEGVHPRLGLMDD